MKIEIDHIKEAKMFDIIIPRKKKDKSIQLKKLEKYNNR